MSDYETMAIALARIVEDGSCDCRPVTFACSWCQAMCALPKDRLELITHWDVMSQNRINDWTLDPRCN